MRKEAGQLCLTSYACLRRPPPLPPGGGLPSAARPPLWCTCMCARCCHAITPFSSFVWQRVGDRRTKTDMTTIDPSSCHLPFRPSAFRPQGPSQPPHFPPPLPPSYWSLPSSIRHIEFPFLSYVAEFPHRLADHSHPPGSGAHRPPRPLCPSCPRCRSCWLSPRSTRRQPGRPVSGWPRQGGRPGRGDGGGRGRQASRGNHTCECSVRCVVQKARLRSSQLRDANFSGQPMMGVCVVPEFAGMRECKRAGVRDVVGPDHRLIVDLKVGHAHRRRVVGPISEFAEDVRDGARDNASVLVVVDGARLCGNARATRE